MYQTIRLKCGDNKPIIFRLLTWDRVNQNMVDFDTTDYNITYELYIDEVDEPFIIDGPCSIDDDTGDISCTLNTATLDLGMYRLAYIASNETETWKFPEYGFQNVFITSDGVF